MGNRKSVTRYQTLITLFRWPVLTSWPHPLHLFHNVHLSFLYQHGALLPSPNTFHSYLSFYRDPVSFTILCVWSIISLSMFKMWNPTILTRNVTHWACLGCSASTCISACSSSCQLPATSHCYWRGVGQPSTDYNQQPDQLYAKEMLRCMSQMVVTPDTDWFSDPHLGLLRWPYYHHTSESWWQSNSTWLFN
jgi:hypothetical protein